MADSNCFDDLDEWPGGTQSSSPGSLGLGVRPPLPPSLPTPRLGCAFRWILAGFRQKLAKSHRQKKKGKLKAPERAIILS